MPIPFFDRAQPGPWISAGLHGAILLAAIVGFSSTRLPVSDEGIPVEVITENQFSEITKGERTAAKVLPEAKPRADRVADTRQERDPGEAKTDVPAPPKRPVEAKVADEESEPAPASPPPPRRVAEAKPEPVAPSAQPPPARPEPPKPDPQAAAKAAEAKAAEARRVDAEKVAERQEAEAIERARVEAAKKSDADQQKKVADAKAKAKAEAEARAKSAAAAKARSEAEAKAELDAKMKQLAEAEAKAEADAAARAKATADAKARADADAKAKAVALARAKADAEAKARKQAEAADKFSPGDISKLLASKEPSQSSGATGRDIQKTASLGTASGTAQKLNPSQRDQLIGFLSEQLHKCWQVPVAAQTADKPPVPTVRLKLNQDGTLSGEPVVTNSGDALFRTVAESATRATRRCAPLRIPTQFQPFYNEWRDLLVNFDPRAVG